MQTIIPETFWNFSSKSKRSWLPCLYKFLTVRALQYKSRGSKWPVCLFWFELAWDIHRQDQILQFPDSTDVCLSKFGMETNSDTFFWHFFEEIFSQSTCFWANKCSEVFPQWRCHEFRGISSQEACSVSPCLAGPRHTRPRCWPCQACPSWPLLHCWDEGVRPKRDVMVGDELCSSI